MRRVKYGICDLTSMTWFKYMKRSMLVFAAPSDPCDGVNCNSGTCSGGACSCPANYYGSNCQTRYVNCSKLLNSAFWTYSDQQLDCDVIDVILF